MDHHWNLYRDLDKVFKYFTAFSKQNTLVVDVDTIRVQLCLKNAIIANEYIPCDVMKQKGPDQDEVRGPDWQKKYMNELADLIISIVEGVEDSVPDYIKNNVDKRHCPEDKFLDIKFGRKFVRKSKMGDGVEWEQIKEK